MGIGQGGEVQKVGRGTVKGGAGTGRSAEEEGGTGQSAQGEGGAHCTAPHCASPPFLCMCRVPSVRGVSAWL